MPAIELMDGLESCDTMVVVAAASATGRTVFAKNSDRNPNEAQYLTVVEGGSHEPDEMVECTYVSIPQAPAPTVCSARAPTGSGASNTA